MMRPLAAAFIGFSLVVTAVASYLAFLPQSSGTVAFWVFSAGPTLVVAAFAAAWAKREDLLVEWLRPRWGDFTKGLLGAVLLFTLAWGFVRLVASVGSTREVWLVSLYGAIGDPRELRAHGPAVGATILAAAISEEVVWRGLVTQLVADRVGSRTAWLWASGLYALALTPTAWSLRASAGGLAGINPVLVFAALAGGLVWGGMARVFDRLVPGIVAHALFDWTVVMMFPLWGVSGGR